MPFPEVYPALESRAVDGQENPLGTINTSKFNEVQKYLSIRATPTRRMSW